MVAPGVGATAQVDLQVRGQTGGEQESEALLRLEPAGSIAGTARDEHGRPVPGATVVRQRYTQEWGYPLDLTPETVLTDVEGAFEFADLPAGTWTVKLDVRDVGGVLRKTVDLAPGQRLGDQNLTVIREGARLSGKVWEPGRKRPVADLTLSALLLDQPRLPGRVLWTASTKLQNGTFRFEHVLPRAGYLLLLGWEPGYAYADRLDLDKQRLVGGLEVELQPGGVISVPNVENRYPNVYVRLPDGEFVRLPAVGGRNRDRYDFKGLPPGEYWLGRNAEAEGAVRCEVKVGETTRVELSAEK